MSQSTQMAPDETPLTVTLRTIEGGSAEVEAVGEVDASTQQRLRDVVIDAVDQGATQVVVDLRGVSFLDSSGLRGMVEAVQRGAVLTLRNLCPAVQRVFDVLEIPAIYIEQ